MEFHDTHVGAAHGRDITAKPAGLAAPKWRRPCQPHPGARVFHYRCFLPDLAEFADYRRGGTNRATIDTKLAEREGFEPSIRV